MAERRNLYRKFRKRNHNEGCKEGCGEGIDVVYNTDPGGSGI
jgi:hypothetical protein